MSKPGSTEAMVGTSGSSGLGLAEVTATARSLPAFTWVRAGAMSDHASGMLPATMSSTTRIEPL